MKPGEFVERQGQFGGVLEIPRVYEVRGVFAHRKGEVDSIVIGMCHPEFPAAVAALQSLIRPSLDPRAGRVLAMGEVVDEDYIDGLRRCRYVSDQPWTRQS